MKKICAVCVTVFFIIMSAFPATAMEPQKIKTLDAQFAQKIALMELDGAAIPGNQLTSLVVAPGSELRLYLMGTEGQVLFYDQDGLPMSPADITTARLLAAQIALTIADAQNDAVVQSAEIVCSGQTPYASSAAPYISIRFSDRITSVEGAPFHFTIALTMAGQVQQQTSLTVSGAMQPLQQVISPGAGIVDLQQGKVLTATADMQVQLRLTEEISLSAWLKQGVKYYAVVERSTGYNEVEYISQGNQQSSSETTLYNLDTLNFDLTKCQVKFESEQPLYIYDSLGEYLGTNRQELPYASQYKVTTQPVITIE